MFTFWKKYPKIGIFVHLLGLYVPLLEYMSTFYKICPYFGKKMSKNWNICPPFEIYVHLLEDMSNYWNICPHFGNMTTF